MANKKKKPSDLTGFKPRNQHLNEVLLSRPAGRMKDKDKELRSREKEKLRNWKQEEGGNDA
ncbi:hypothetical protein [Acinetobacter sp.]|uniref:hypothetical protein n=1 Tax=Acinetobacter sp. TaxID=472 RepID=UPI00388D907C